MTSHDLSLPRRLFIASRPISWINTAYPFGVTYYLLTGRVDGLLVLGSLFFLVPYNVVMYGVNDVFDYASDVKNPRKGGVEGALLPPQTHRAVLLVCALISLPLMLWMMLSGPWLAALVLVLLMLDVVAYSAPPLRTKERPFWDSLTSSIHFVGPMVYAVVLTGSTWTPPLVMMTLSFLAWGIAAHAFGAVQDVVPDRQAGLKSIATEFGARATVCFSLALWAMSGLLLLALGFPDALVGLAILPYIALAAPFAGITDETSAAANKGWKKFLWVNYSAGFALTMYLIFRTLAG